MGLVGDNRIEPDLVLQSVQEIVEPLKFLLQLRIGARVEQGSNGAQCGRLWPETHRMNGSELTDRSCIGSTVIDGNHVNLVPVQCQSLRSLIHTDSGAI